LTIRQNKKNTAESENSSVDKKAISSGSDKEEENGNPEGHDDEYILNLCKQQSFKNKDEADDLLDTANSTPEKGEKSVKKNEKSR
jgi:hypothetical protein